MDRPRTTSAKGATPSLSSSSSSSSSSLSSSSRRPEGITRREREREREAEEERGAGEEEEKGEGLVDAVIVCFGEFLKGMWDASQWPAALSTTYRSKKIMNRAVQCFVLNGVIFVGSIVLFNRAVVPLLHWLFDNPLVSSSFSTPGETVSPWVQSLVDRVLFAMYYILWVYPIYTSSFVLNSLWYQEIADEAYLVQIGKPSSSDASYDSMVKKITDIIYEIILFFIFLIQIFLISVVPMFGRLVSFVFFCWLYAFYSFEYKWINKGWTVERRLDYLESRWSYFAGFGFPGAALTFYFPQFISAGVFALVFPMYIMMANTASPVPKYTRKSPHLLGSSIRTKMPIFDFSKKISLAIIRWIERQFRSSRAKNVK